MLRWAFACLTARLGHSARSVWGQGRQGLCEHLAECAHHGSHRDALEDRDFVPHFVLQLIQHAAHEPLLRLWTLGAAD